MAVGSVGSAITYGGIFGLFDRGLRAIVDRFRSAANDLIEGVGDITEAQREANPDTPYYVDPAGTAKGAPRQRQAKEAAVPASSGPRLRMPGDPGGTVDVPGA